MSAVAVATGGSLTFSVPNSLRRRLSPTLLPSHSLLPISFLTRSSTLRRRRLPRATTAVPELQAPEDDGESDGGDDGDEGLGFDVDELEREAKDAWRDHSRSISRELSIESEGASEGMESKGKKKRRNFVPGEVPDHLLPKVVIIGRPNVGKSALFNRLVGGNRAIVVDEPGVTRDRLYGRSFWGDIDFMVIDTGGVLSLPKTQENIMEGLNILTTIGMEGIPQGVREAAVARMPSLIERQAATAVEESSAIIFLVDGQAGPTAGDEEIARWLLKNYSEKNIVLAVNKCESPRKGLMQAMEFWNLGFSLIAISAITGTGTGEMLRLVCSGLKKIEEPANLEEEENRTPAIAIVGKPNVGKSSILNALVGEERTIVSPISGTTRDAIDTEFIGPDGQKFRLIDTAGIRKKASVASSGSTTEALSVNRAFQAVRRSDVVAFVIDALACVTEQDYKIADRIEKEGKGCVLVVNKWDTIPDKNHQTVQHYEEDVRVKLRILHWAPIVYSTALSGQNVDKDMVEGEKKGNVLLEEW